MSYKFCDWRAKNGKNQFQKERELSVLRLIIITYDNTIVICDYESICAQKMPTIINFTPPPLTQI